jgi:hypothetical protein
MGKAAKNEGHKLAATYWNNIAVGFMLAGFVIPYLNLYQLSATISSWHDVTNFIATTGVAKIYWTVAAIVAAFMISLAMHRMAQNALKLIED